MGLQYPYRVTELRGQWVVYQVRDGRIVEYLPVPEGSITDGERQFRAREAAINRLLSIDGLKRELKQDIQEEIDQQE